MEKIKSFVLSHYIIILLCLLLVAGIVIPLCGVQTFLGHDVYFHMTRMEALAQEIDAGNIPARLYYFVYDGYGYASPMFYGDLFLIIPALLILAGVPMPLAYKAFMIICLCACLLMAYYCGKKIFGKKTAGVCFAFTYAVSSYFAVDVFTRAAIGEMQAFIFVPLAFLGLHSILHDKGKYWYYLPLGLAAVLFSHMLTSVMTAFFLLVYALIHIKSFVKKPIKIAAVAFSAVVFAAIAASFMFPLLEQLADTKFISTDGTSATYFGTMAQRSMTIRQLFSLFNLNEEHKYWIPNGIGYLPLILVVFRLFVLKKQKFCLGDGYFITANCCLFLISSKFPWESEFFQSLLGTMQFPWRIMLFATLFLALAVADYSTRIDRRDTAVFTALVCLAGVFAFGSVYIPRYNLYSSYEESGHEVVYYKDKNIGFNIGTGEYLPSGTNRNQLFYRGKIIRSDGHNTDFVQKKNGDIYIPIKYIERNGTWMDLPLINYKGYTAVFTDTLGNEIPLDISYGDDNVVRLDITPIKADGTVYVTYSGTAIQHVSFVVSVISCILLGGWILFCRLKEYWLAPKQSQRNTPPQEDGVLSDEAPAELS
jgi:hypothetical protein